VYSFKGQAIDVARPQRAVGTLLVIDHPPRIIMGTAFEGFREYRLTAARKR